MAATGDSYYGPLAIFLGYERDAIFGGAYGHSWGGWLDLSLLWVAEPLHPLREKGYGSNLLEAAEDEAKARGCRGVFLSNDLVGMLQQLDVMPAQDSTAQ